jgi:DNA primase
MPKYIDFAELKEQVGIEDVFPMLELHMMQKGDQWRGACPACEDSDRSLVVTSSKGAFYCFSAKKGGDVISLVAHVRDLGMRDAALAIAEYRELVPEPPAANRTGTSTSKRTVPNSAGGKETQKLQPLAYLDAAHETVEALGLSPATCERFGAGYAPKGILRGRLAIPIHDLNGELVAYCGRAVRDDQSPILSFPKGFDPSAYVFNLHRMVDGDLYCTFDPLDVLLAFENGIENAIAFLHRAEETNVVPIRTRA